MATMLPLGVVSLTLETVSDLQGMQQLNSTIPDIFVTLESACSESNGIVRNIHRCELEMFLELNG